MTRLIPVALVAALVLGWTVGCAGGGGAFRDRAERAERALLQRQADEEAALRAQDERERQALQELEEDADRRKREETEDLQQERRHRRERKEAEHDADLRELYRGSQRQRELEEAEHARKLRELNAEASPAKLPPELENYLNAYDRLAAAETEFARNYAECIWTTDDTADDWKECTDRLRLMRALNKNNEARSDAVAADGMIPQGAARYLLRRLWGTKETKALNETRNAAKKASAEKNAAGEIYDDAAAAYHAAPAHSNADEAAAWRAAWRKWRAADRAWAKALTAEAAAVRAYANRARLFITPEAYQKARRYLESQTAATSPAQLPPELENYLNAYDRFVSAATEAARIHSECSLLDTVRELNECHDRLRQNWAIKKRNEANADAGAAIDMIPPGAARYLWRRSLETKEWKAYIETDDAANKAQDEMNAAREIYNDAAAAYHAAPAHSNADEKAVMDAASRKLRAANRALAKAATAQAAADRAYATRARLIITPEAYQKARRELESQTAATGPAQ